MKKDSRVQNTTIHQEIVLTSIILFSKIGFEKTTISDIARALNMSSANIYRYFPARVNILYAAINHILATDFESVNKSIKNESSASQKIYNIFFELSSINMNRFFSNENIHKLIMEAYDKCWSSTKVHAESLESLIASIIKEGQQSGEFEIVDCMDYASVIQRICLLCYHPRFVVQLVSPAQPLVREIVIFCLHALRGEPARLRLVNSQCTVE